MDSAASGSPFDARSAVPPEVVHPHGCPKCGSNTLNRIHRAWEEIEQPLDRLWTHYEGLVGLRAAVVPDALRTVVAAGVNGHRIVCAECGYKGDLPEFVAGYFEDGGNA